MATNKLQWKRIAMGDKLPCQSFLRKKNGEILKLSTVAGVTVGQDCYYLPVDEVINVIKGYPVEESEDERIKKNIIATIHLYYGEPLEEEAKEMIAWLEKQGEHANFRNKIQIGDKVTRNQDGVLVNLSQLNRVAKKEEKQDDDKVEPKFKVGDVIRLKGSAAEYTRTDVFIKKACEWIREFNKHHYIMRYSDSCEQPLSELTEWFKNYMKGE